MVCPICKKPVAKPASDGAGSFYPFCSDRCKLIDLGRWLGGKYQIPAESEDGGSVPEGTGQRRTDEGAEEGPLTIGRWSPRSAG